LTDIIVSVWHWFSGGNGNCCTIPWTLLSAHSTNDEISAARTGMGILNMIAYLGTYL